MRRTRAVVCGGGGFIGGHLVSTLRGHGGYEVRAIDAKPLGEWHQRFSDVDNRVLDLRDKESCRKAVRDTDVVYNLAANVGGAGFTESNKALCMLSVLINTHLLESARESGVERFFYASSASVYAANKQSEVDSPALKEEDIYPAMPEDGHGWEKLFSERMCGHFREGLALNTRIARFHNVYGPWGTFQGGREHAPAAICRKIAEATMTGRREIPIWGDGEQTRSFTYIDDCVEGIQRIVASDVTEPLNLGSSERVSINQLVDVVEDIAGVKLRRSYDLSAPTGVRGRNSDNTKIQELLDWQPSISLQDGLEQTYRWIFDEMSQQRYAKAA